MASSALSNPIFFFVLYLCVCMHVHVCVQTCACVCACMCTESCSHPNSQVRRLQYLLKNANVIYKRDTYGEYLIFPKFSIVMSKSVSLQGGTRDENGEPSTRMCSCGRMGPRSPGSITPSTVCVCVCVISSCKHCSVSAWLGHNLDWSVDLWVLFPLVLQTCRSYCSSLSNYVVTIIKICNNN